MVSILPFASNSSTDTCSTSATLTLRLSSFKPLKPNPITFLKQKPFKFSSFKILAAAASSSSSPIEDGSADQFLQNNSIADFMRFKTGANGGSGKLQTAVVTYRKKFPWSLLRPFLEVQSSDFFN